MSASLLSNKQIAIVGAGPSGLTLARLLQMSGANVRVFDLDATPFSRDQGGELDMHEESGQVAIRRAGLEKEFAAVSRPEAQISQVFDKHGKRHLHFGVDDEKITRPEIPRAALRKLFLDALTFGTVSWDRHLKLVERAPDGRRRLIFADGSSFDADLLFGADGVWSKVRPLVTPVKAQYSGLTFIESKIMKPETQSPAASDLVGAGTILVTSDDKALMGQRNGDGHIRIYVILRVPENWHRSDDIDFSNPKAAREQLLKHYEGWAPHLRAMVQDTDDTFTPRPLYNVPLDQTWDSQPDVALLGDAAHVMPPWTGKGANYAMLDAVELADQLLSNQHKDVASAIRAYDSGMLKRMHAAVAETMASQSVMVAPDAPAGVLAIFQQRVKQALEAKR